MHMWFNSQHESCMHVRQNSPASGQPAEIYAVENLALRLVKLLKKCLSFHRENEIVKSKAIFMTQSVNKCKQINF